VDAAVKISQREGVLALYAGLSAGVTRQASYTTLRAGLYQIFRDKMAGGSKETSFGTKLICGLASGATAATICCPVEVSLIRMQADGRLPPEERRNYKNVFDGILRIAREEGIATCWRGSTPTVVRAMVVNMVQMATYDEAKRTLQKQNAVSSLKAGLPLHFASSLTSGFLYSAASLPFDIAKTRMQNQKALADGSRQYSNIFQTLMLIVRLEGPAALWKGFAPYFGRSGLHTVGMFMILEQLKRIASTKFGYSS